MRAMIFLLMLSTPAFAQRIAQVQIVKNGTMVATSHSIGIDVGQAYLASIQAYWTGSPVGTMSVQVSNDDVRVATATSSLSPVDPAANVVHWTTATDIATASVNTTTGSLMFNPIYPGYRWLRLNYTSSSATGVLNAELIYKGN